MLVVRGVKIRICRLCLQSLSLSLSLSFSLTQSVSVYAHRARIFRDGCVVLGVNDGALGCMYRVYVYNE